MTSAVSTVTAPSQNLNITAAPKEARKSMLKRNIEDGVEG